jgi:hypothetical protein
MIIHKNAVWRIHENKSRTIFVFSGFRVFVIKNSI